MKEKKLKCCNKKLDARTKKINSLKHLLEDLKNKDLVHGDSVDILSVASSVNREFLLRQLRKAQGLPLPNDYSSELKAFALILNFLSTTAYEKVLTKSCHINEPFQNGMNILMGNLVLQRRP